MVNDLLLIARFDENRMDLAVTPLNLGEIVRDLHEFYLPMAQEKKLQFSIEQCDDVVLPCDKTRIHQLFSNLIDNAIKFTMEGGSIALSLAADNRAVQFRVKDTGIGIPAVDIPNIFNRFYQSDKSLLRRASAPEAGSGCISASVSRKRTGERPRREQSGRRGNRYHNAAAARVDVSSAFWLYCQSSPAVRVLF